MDSAFLPTNETGHCALDFPGGKINNHPSIYFGLLGLLTYTFGDHPKPRRQLSWARSLFPPEYSPLVRYVQGGGSSFRFSARE